MKKVILGLSGGVDSFASLIILLKEGYDVEAMFMRNWDSAINNDILGNPNINNDICPQEQDYNDAVKICKKLNVKLHRIDFVSEYWDYVFSYFLNEYKMGRTPNPDIMCNKEIKFKAFLKHAMSLGADYIAMGHYAKVLHKENKSYLLRAVDTSKDQTYFLAFINQQQLRKALFPIGDMIKQDVRKLCVEYDYEVGVKKDSTGICFIGERNFKEFLQNYIPANKGLMMTLDKEVIGEHDGLMYYTIGQRKGLMIGGSNNYLKEAWFVIGKDIKNNILYVGQSNDEYYLYSNNCICTDLNIISDDIIENKEYSVKFRYRSADVKAYIKFLDDGKIQIIYKDKAKAVTPGQAAVIYDNDVCMGGAIISEVYFDDERRMC